MALNLAQGRKIDALNKDDNTESEWVVYYTKTGEFWSHGERVVETHDAEVFPVFDQAYDLAILSGGMVVERAALYTGSM